MTMGMASALRPASAFRTSQPKLPQRMAPRAAAIRRVMDRKGPHCPRAVYHCISRRINALGACSTFEEHTYERSPMLFCTKSCIRGEAAWPKSYKPLRGCSLLGPVVMQVVSCCCGAVPRLTCDPISLTGSTAVSQVPGAAAAATAAAGVLGACAGAEAGCAAHGGGADDAHAAGRGARCRRQTASDRQDGGRMQIIGSYVGLS